MFVGAMEYRSGLMGLGTKENGKTVRPTAKVLSVILRKIYSC
jgi:hypothetical protein